jgi:phosphatidylglycerophosphate synthase
MLVRADRIYGNDLIAEAAKLEPKGDGALEAAAGGGNEAAAGEGDEDGRVGIMVASPEFLADQTVGKDAGSSDEGLVDVYVRLRDGGRKKGAVETARLASSFWHRVEKPADLRPARDALFQSLGKPIDGFISRHFNRPVSQAVSKRISNLPFTPNQISAVVFLIGLAAAGVTLLMDWVWVAVGAVLFHAASVFDGVDGEIARVKFQATKFGALLDSILDHIVMVAWILAIGYVIYWRGGSFFYPILGYVVFFCTAVGSAMVNYEQVVKTRSGQPMEVEWDFEKEEHKDKLISKVINSIRFFVSRDADCVVLGLFAIFNFLEPIPIIGATVAIVYFTVVLGHQIRKLFAGSAESSAADGSE